MNVHSAGRCAHTDCLHCNGCPDGSIHLNVTERVAQGECVEYHDGICEQLSALWSRSPRSMLCPTGALGSGTASTCGAPTGCSPMWGMVSQIKIKQHFSDVAAFSLVEMGDT